MIDVFQNLQTSETDLLFKIPSLVTILIAGADNNVDEKEKEWASKIVNYRRIVGDKVLFEYYEQIEAKFELQLLEITNDYPKGLNERNQKIEAEIVKANDILSKINQEYAVSLVKSWRSLAKQVAKASGGLMGFGAISSQEEEHVKLKILTL